MKKRQFDDDVWINHKPGVNQDENGEGDNDGAEDDGTNEDIDLNASSERPGEEDSAGKESVALYVCPLQT